MSLGRYRPWGQPQEKIRPEHRDRAAVVYVRQPGRQQVLEHSESTRLQYALTERAAALGWARSQIVVIDDDLGVPAATADSRKGFARLVTEVTMGRAGVVLGIEMSRLARTGRDWHQLLELCSLSGVLLAGPDGIYDPGYYNDRLLLGLKGTMSEALCRYRHNASYADLEIMPTLVKGIAAWTRKGGRRDRHNNGISAAANCISGERPIGAKNYEACSLTCRDEIRSPRNGAHASSAKSGSRRPDYAEFMGAPTTP